MHTHEAIIIGAGPIGIETAIALKREGIDYVQVEAKQIGDTISWYAPQTHFFSSPERIQLAGVPLQTLDQTKATREEYLLYLRTIVQQFDLDIRTGHVVTDIRRERDAFAISCQTRTGPAEFRARRIVLAHGDMHAPRLLGIAGEDLPHVSHYLREPHHYFGRRVLIVGGKNSAVEAALRLFRAGAHVTVSYRRAEFSERIKYWLRPELLALIKEGRIGFLPRTLPVEITPRHVVLVGTDEQGQPITTDGEPTRFEADEVLLLTGYVQDTALFDVLGVELEGKNRAPVHDPRTMETNVPGVHVAGTASAGTQHGVTVFIETSHVHARRIACAIAGKPVPEEAQAEPDYALPES